jgi:MFS family permease
MNNGGGTGKDRKKGLAWAVGAWWAGVAAGLVAHAPGWAFPGDSFGDVLLLVALVAYWVPLALGVLVLLVRMAAGWVRELRHREWRRAELKLAGLCGLVAAGTALMNIRVREPVVVLVAFFAAGAVCAFVAIACTVGYAVKGILSAGRKRKQAP